MIDDNSRKRLEARARIVKAMAHPTRLYILEVLEQGEKCVCDLRDLIGADLSTVSKHLAQLRQAGIVVDEKRGQQVWYRLKCPCVRGFFECIESVLATNAAEAREAI